jgi:hypothetical protein
VALTPGNPVVGGTVLRRQAIQSPNYVLGLTGWAIRQDGTAQFTGIVLIGGTFTGTNFVINSSGAFFYSGTPAAGNLIASIASASGSNDGHGNAYVAGVAAYVKISSGTGAGTYAVALGDQATPWAGFAALTFQNQTHPATRAPGVLANVDPAAGAELSLQSGLGTGATVGSAVSLFDSTSGAADIASAADLWTMSAASIGVKTLLRLVGALRLDDITVPAAASGGAVLFADAGGFPRYKADSASGDTNVWELGAIHLAMTGTLPQAINSTSYAALQGLSTGTAQVGTGTYRIRANLIVNQGAAAATQNFRFGGTAVLGTGPNRIQADFLAAGGAVGFSSVINLGSSALQSPAYGGGATFHVNIEGHYTFGTAGTLELDAANQTATDTMSVVDGSLDIEPAI